MLRREFKLTFAIAVFIDVFLFLLTFVSNVFASDLGVPPIQNFLPQTYKAHGQNWVGIQDKRGVMYFGNTLGILEYDGVNWRLLKMPHNTTTRSLELADDGTIYYGAHDDLGVLVASSDGRVVAQSLREIIPKEEQTFNDIWQILNAKNGLYFIATDKIFRLKDGVITTIRGRFGRSQNIVMNGELFVMDVNRGFCLVHDDDVVPLGQFSEVSNGSIIAMAPSDNHQIVVARGSGDMLRLDLSNLWNESSHRYSANLNSASKNKFVQELHSEIGSFLTIDKGLAYRLYRIDSSHFALATKKAGVVIFDRAGKFVRSFNKQNGLIDNSISNIFVDRSKNLWVSANTGISHVEASIPQSYYGEANGLDGALLAAYRYKNRMYVGSFQQVLVQEPFKFSAKQTIPKFRPVKDGAGSIWQFLEVDGDLLAASFSGLMVVQDEKASIVPQSPTYGFSLGTSTKWPHHIFMGGIGYVAVFKRDQTGWKFVGKIPGISETIRHIEQNENGDLWLSTQAKGFLLCRFSSTALDVKLQRYDVDHGLPSGEDLDLTFINGHPVAATTKGVYRAIRDDKNSQGRDFRFVEDADFSRFFNNPPLMVNNLRNDGKGGVLVNLSDHIAWVARDELGKYQVRHSVFKTGPATDVPLFVEDSGVVWIPSLGLTRIDLSTEKDYQHTFQTLIRRVVTHKKEVLFGGTYAATSKTSHLKSIFEMQAPQSPPRILAFQDNALSFDFSATFFEKRSGLKFRFKLEGFDDDWSEWAQLTSKEYSYIPSGVYKFRVQSRNAYEVDGVEASYRFQIAPPWFRTWWAWVLWTVLTATFLFLGVRFYTNRLVREKQILEKLVAERTRELREASLTDPLTGLRNRRFIGEILQNDTSAFIKYKNYLLSADNNNKRLSTADDEVFGVFLLDLDHFKHVNDKYGHEGGDRVLKQFAHILMSSVRADDVVIRLGGEEFLIVLKKTQAQHLHNFAQTLLRKVQSSKFDVGGDVIITKTCSIGYTSYPFDPRQPDAPSFEQIIVLADMGMYHAKNNGRNNAVFIEKGPNWDNETKDISKILGSLEFAIEGKYAKIRVQLPASTSDSSENK